MARGKAAVALRYALAPACIGAAVLLHGSPAGALFHPTGPFILGVLAAAWFGGAGPGVLAAFLSAISFPQLAPVASPLLAGFFDLGRFVTLGLTGAAVGWGAASLRRARAAARAAARERERHESDARFRSLTELSSDFFWETDTEHRYTVIELGRAYAGVRNNEAKVGLARWEIPYASPAKAAWAAHRATIAARERFADFAFSRIEAGEERFYEHSGEPRYDAQGNFLGYRGVGRDVTARRRAEEALRRSEERHSLAIEASEEGYVDANFDTDEFITSERLNEIFGIAPGMRFKDRDDFLRQMRFYGDDGEIYHQAMRAVAAEGGPDRYQFEFRIVLPSGEVRWLRTRGKVTRDAAGRARRRVGVVADITARKLAQEALRGSEERYALAMEAAGDGHTDWNLETGEFYISPRMLSILGYAPGTTFADRADWVRRFPFHPEDRPRWEAAIAEHFAGREATFRIDLRTVVNGETRWVAFTFIATRDASGKPVRWTGSIADVTEAKLAEEALRESQERYALAVDGSNDGIWDWDLLTGKMFVSERAQLIFGLEPGPTERLREEWHAMIDFHPDDHRAQRQMVEDYLSGARNSNEGEWRVQSKDGGGYRWIRIRSICLRNPAGEPVRMAGSVSDIDAQKKAEEATRESEARFRSLIDVAPVAIVLTTQRPPRVLQVNQEFTRMFGFTAEETVGRSLRELIAPGELHEGYAVNADAMTEGTKVEREVVRQRKDGSRFHLHLTGVPIRLSNGIECTFLMYRDLTERELAADALRKSEERFALAVAGSDDGVWDVDFVARRVFLSARARELTGLPPGPEMVPYDEFTAMLPIHPDDAPRRLAAVQAHLTGKAPAYEGEFRLRQRDGVYRWRRIHGICVRDANGQPRRMAGSFSDIDARRRAEEALRLSEERYALAVAGANDGIWDEDLVTGMLYRSPRNQEIALGRPSDGIDVRRRDEWAQWHQIHPEDAPKRAAAMRLHLEGRTPHYEIEYRVRHPDGIYHWIHARGVCTRDASGRAVRIAGSTTNIDARKAAEEALRGSEARFRSLTELSSDWYWKQDENLRFVSYLPPELGTRSGVPAAASLGKARWEFDNTTPLSSSWEEHKALLAARQPFRDFEYLRLDDAGVPNYIAISGVPTFDGDGRFTGYEGIARDITARKQAEDTLRESEARFRRMTELSADTYWEQDEHFRYTRTGEAADIAGYTTDVNLGKTRWQLSGEPTALSSSWQEHQALLAARQPFRDFEYSRRRPGGTIGYYSASGAPMFDAEGRFRGYQGVARDLTQRKRIEEELRSRQEMLELAQKAARAVPWEWKNDAGPAANRWSLELEALFGLPPGGFDGSAESWWKLCHPGDRERVKSAIAHALATGEIDVEYRVIHPDGRVRWLNQKGRAFVDANGKPVRSLGVMFDVTERRKVEDELRSRQEMLDLAQKSARAVAYEWKIGAGEGENRWSADLEAMYGLAPGTYDGTFETWKKLVHAEDRPAVMKAILHAQRTGEISAEYRVVHLDGSVHWLQSKGRMLFDAAGKPGRIVGFMQDITERRRVEEALRQSEERYALAVAGSNEGIFDWDLVSDRVYVSNRAQELFGLPHGELWRPRRDWRHILTFHPEDAPRLHDSIKAHIEGSTPTYDVEFRIVLADGGERWYRQRGIALRDDSGKAYRVVGSIGDVTEKHRTEQELGSLERQLRMAQRLESMGTLAGGIAHDFNNILGAILGYGEMALRDAKSGTRLRRDLDSIMAAGERGRALIDRILAFSRSGVGERVPVHVEAVVREALDQVAASLPADVTIAPRLRAGRAALLGDSTQVHQVVMNLASNAVHAMPQGGVLRVALETAHLDTARMTTVGGIVPGDYLVLTVSDTGTGIPQDVLESMFDPFFTTKEVGVGSGLGLSLVHGIVTSVGGAIDVATELGKGTTFTVYLRRSGDAPEETADQDRPLPRGEGERVLVVDDEEPLVRLATETLERLGYAAVGFTSSAAALAAFRADPERFDALLTDERMPGLTGSSLIREVRGIRAALPVVLMSGYLGMESVDADVVVRKPLSASDLASSMARALHP